MNISEFQDLVEIGHGGMGIVYQGYANGKKIAIKEIRRDYLSEADLIDRFRQEARVIDRLNHPSIVKIVKPQTYTDMTYYPAFEENGNLYLAMEFIEGETLDKYVKHYSGGIPESEAINIMSQVLDAMEYVRLQKLVHRDIKPSNIFVRPDKTVCIIDFGIVKDINSNGLTTGRCILGTNGYMSPEQAQGGLTIDYRTDIYSLGCVLFYMLTGVHAIQTRGTDLETRIAILKEKFPHVKDFNPSVSDKVQNAIEKAVDKNMLLRFQSPLEFKQALVYEGNTIKSSGTVSYSAKSITIGRDPNSNLPIYDSQGKVSRHHMDISWENVPDGILYTFYDRSTNGSMVNEQFIKGGSCSLIDSHRFKLKQEKFSPVIILAGTVLLDWEDVKAAINKVSTSDDSSTLDQDDDVSTSNDADVNDSISIGYGILSFIVPIVGWVLYYQWKESTPNKAKAVCTLAWISFGINFLWSTVVMIVNAVS